MGKLTIAGLVMAVASGAALADGFSQKRSYAGPVLGFGWHDLMLGAQYEYGISRYVGLGAIGGVSWESHSDY